MTEYSQPTHTYDRFGRDYGLLGAGRYGRHWSYYYPKNGNQYTYERAPLKGNHISHVDQYTGGYDTVHVNDLHPSGHVGHRAPTFSGGPGLSDPYHYGPPSYVDPSQSMVGGHPGGFGGAPMFGGPAAFGAPTYMAPQMPFF